VSRALQRIVSLALLTVLSGTPAVAAICAALCLPVHHAQQAGENQGCHGRAGAGPVVSSTGDVDCADHGLAGVPTMASLAGSRGPDHAAMTAVEGPVKLHALAAAASARGSDVPARDRWRQR
jgi:hypothetical protein